MSVLWFVNFVRRALVGVAIGFGGLWMSFVSQAWAQTAVLIPYTGRVMVGTTPFQGTGQFKFALLNGAGSTVLWGNAPDVAPVDDVPDAFISRSVSQGMFSVLLGDTGIPNMASVPVGVLGAADIRVRVWFNDGVNGFQKLAPDIRLGSEGYLADGSVTTAKLANQAVDSAQIAPGAITTGKINNGAVTSAKLDTGIAATKLSVGSVDNSEFDRLDGVTQPIQSQLDGKAPRHEIGLGVIPVRGMVWIRPGAFLMGSREDEPQRDGDEGPQTLVTLTRPFWIGAHEVTQSEYSAVMGSNPSLFPGIPSRPVENVTWEEATSFCVALTLVERGAGRIPANWGYRLPTEAEWEYCARAGARTTRYAHGDDLVYEAIANYAWFVFTAADNATHPVEQKFPNPWGLCDLHGNVWEWCQDFYSNALPGGAQTDPGGPNSGAQRVIRGGSWFNNPESCRSAARTGLAPTSKDNRTGFRIVLSIIQ